MTQLGYLLSRRCEREDDWVAFLDALEAIGMAAIEAGVHVTSESFEGYAITGVPACMPMQLLTAVQEARDEMDDLGRGQSGQHDFSGGMLRT